MSDESTAPRPVWIPQITLAGNRDDVAVYDLGAFTSESEARRAMAHWLDEERARGGGVTEAVINIVPVYQTADEWAADR